MSIGDHSASNQPVFRIQENKYKSAKSGMSKPKFPKLQFNVLSVAEHQYGTCATARCIEQETFVIDLQ